MDVVRLIGTVNGVSIYADPYMEKNNILNGKKDGSLYYVCSVDTATLFKDSLRSKYRKNKIKLIFNI